jgi:large-conductance mechanosensitive channel
MSTTDFRTSSVTYIHLYIIHIIIKNILSRLIKSIRVLTLFLNYLIYAMAIMLFMFVHVKFVNDSSLHSNSSDSIPTKEPTEMSETIVREIKS